MRTELQNSVPVSHAGMIVPMFLYDRGDARQLVLWLESNTKSLEERIRGQNISRRAQADDAASQEHDLVAGRGFLDIVGGSNEGRTASQLCLHGLDVSVLSSGVESSRRLV